MAVEVDEKDLQAKEASHSASLSFAQFGLLIQSALLGSGLVEEHVVVVGLSPHDLARSRDFKPLRRCLAGLQLWHSSAFLAPSG